MKLECLLVFVCLIAAVLTRSVREVKDDSSESSEEIVPEVRNSEVEGSRIQCAEVVCPPSCHEVKLGDDCPSCVCGVECSPPNCNPGCRAKLDKSKGPCPECVCDIEEAEHQNISQVQPKFLAECRCDWRYLKHYETKKCAPVYEVGCDCPVRFDCPDGLSTADNVCEYKGKPYQLGEEIETASPCEICSCRSSFRGGVEISCIPIECPSLFRPRPEENCYEVFEAGKCCSVDVKCVNPEEEIQENVTALTCIYNGKEYLPGQRIYPEEDSCMSCTCDDNWSGINVNSCKIHECLLERKLTDLKRGCIPIYHEKTCCPIEFYCGSDDDDNQNETLTLKSDGGCMFRGKSYSIGEELDIQHPTNCVKCTCQTPPDFTCVHASCPRPPNDDYDNCRPTYHKEECCPTYDCPEISQPLICEPVKCVNGCKEIWAPNGCPLCLCDETLLCAPPKCPEACEVEYDVPGGKCPHCKCPITVQMAPVQCSPVKCDAQCFEGTGSDGCLMCLCGVLCSPTKCDDPCTLQTDVPQGQCPGCVCPTSFEEGGALDGQQIQCAPVKCGPTCREAVGQFGCPTCLCDPLCSPPKCDPGCEIEINPSNGPCPGCVCKDGPTHNIQCSPPKCDPGCEVELIPSSGPCPGCVCKDKTAGDAIIGDVQCAPVKCGPTCREAIGQFGCPTCLCEPMCSPPKCDPGCDVKVVPSLGPCPGCVCADTKASDIQCAPVKCGPTCREAIGQFGCPTCLCDPLCSPPKCDPGCHVERVPSSGPCPGCVCTGKKSAVDIQCAPVKCDSTCRETIGQSGCPSCQCGPLCSPPRCDPGCHVESVPSSGPCPGCVCVDQKAAGIQCAPVKCGPTCREAIGQFGCPTCLCDPLCSPPKCDPGCHVGSIPSSGPCPGCVCPDQKAADVQCAPVKCGPTCRETISQFGCNTCQCGPLCSPPRCDPGCHVESVPSSGPCPGCVCADQKHTL